MAIPLQTATYGSATFFAKGDQDLDYLIAKFKALDINMDPTMILVKVSSNYHA